MRDAATLSAAELASKRDIALAEPLLAGNLVALDGVTTAVAVTLQYPEQDLTEVPRAVNFARDLATGIEADYPDLDVAITGVSALNNAFAEAGQRDATSLIPAMYGLLIVFSFVVLRSLAGVVATVLVIVFSTLVALGVGGHIGWALDPVAATAPVIIMTLAVADSIHILTTLRSLMREGRDKLAALAEAVRINFLAVTITSFTTVVGFLTLNFSDAPPFKHLGTLAAVGIAAAWLFALILLPAVIRLLPVRVAPATDDRRGLVPALNRLADFVTTHYRGVLLVMGTVTLTLIAFVPRSSSTTSLSGTSTSASSSATTRISRRNTCAASISPSSRSGRTSPAASASRLPAEPRVVRRLAARSSPKSSTCSATPTSSSG